MPVLKKEYELKNVFDLIPHPENPRTHSEAQVWEIANIIKKIGYINDIVIDENDMVLSGHGRTLAAQKLGMKTIPCIRVYGLTAAEKRIYCVADNKIALNAEWDEELLKVNIEEILKSEEIDMRSFGFTIEDLRSMDVDVSSYFDGTDGDRDSEFMPKLPDEDQDLSAKEKDLLLIVKFEDEDQQQELFDELNGRGFKVKI